jgi:coenzyme F420-0:L-glutamate ligase / coenzyme F420-1:gamma-L-glutamate ligase
VISIIPLEGLPEIRPGNDLAALLAVPLAPLPRTQQDVLVVAQKIISKAEGRFRRLSGVTPGETARALALKVNKDPRLVEIILAESSGVIRAAPNILITRHRSGHVMANAGVDQSNLGDAAEDSVLLLPEDADASAATLRTALGPDAPAIIISDSFGRPWRMGVTGVAIGAAGLPALQDFRGQPDRDGRLLQVTQIGLADMIATAALLAMGEAAQGIPAALVCGLSWQQPDVPARALVRAADEDLFR